MSALLERLDALVFAPAPALRLGIARAVYAGGILAITTAIPPLRDWGALPAALFEPLPAFRLLGLGRASPETIGALEVAWRAALVLATVGLATRAALAVACALGFYLLGLSQCFWLDHRTAIVVITLGILACSRSGDAFSLDALIAARLGRSLQPGGSGGGLLLPGRSRRVDPLEPCAEYGWPLFCVTLVISLAFLAAGIAKLRHAPGAWLAGDQLRAIFAHALFEAPRRMPLPAMTEALMALPLVCRAAGIFAVATEVLFPLSLVSLRARLLLVPASVAFQIGNGVLLGVRFDAFMLSHVFWLPWERLLPQQVPAKSVTAPAAAG